MLWNGGMATETLVSLPPESTGQWVATLAHLQSDAAWD